MAKQERPALENSGARAACINDGFLAMFELESQIEALKEKHLKPIQDQLKKLRRDLKADVDMETKDLSVFYAVFKRDRLARDMEDEADRDRILDNLRETFEALASGGQLDWLDAAVSDLESDADATEAAFAQGQKEGKAGATMNKNAFRDDAPARESYEKGWKTGQEELMATSPVTGNA